METGPKTQRWSKSPRDCSRSSRGPKREVDRHADKATCILLNDSTLGFNSEVNDIRSSETFSPKGFHSKT